MLKLQLVSKRNQVGGPSIHTPTGVQQNETGQERNQSRPRTVRARPQVTLRSSCEGIANKLRPNCRVADHPRTWLASRSQERRPTFGFVRTRSAELLSDAAKDFVRKSRILHGASHYYTTDNCGCLKKALHSDLHP
jgi:hypothetical protein